MPEFVYESGREGSQGNVVFSKNAYNGNRNTGTAAEMKTE